eukprot:CAMPEP_0170492806 /NCGR_PEP_ID=MMETSP0208-20121228/12890_1 /TAXON_ID=197538 /ORGANISM="Strombidium inclinatum, Strain S3" /LENGTH=203 /DNA_ID=CAMNT_0010768621 /DNA_START=9 /DNA_END=620 /DNA_ORIENTATION=+
MKYFAVALIGATSAMQMRDAPPFFNEPPHTEHSPSAAGFLQTTSCVSAGVDGVTCAPANHMLFASGMNGDEDLGEDISMKGDKFHYAQNGWNPVVVKTEGALPPCHGTNGPDGVNCAREVCSGTNGPLDGHTGTPCTKEEPASIPHYNTDPTSGRAYETTGDLTRTSLTMLQGDDAAAAEPEKVSVLDTPHARTHTTYYGQRN